jgi:putative copper export protein/mono/diheme cytochrome c family protein
VIALAAAIRAVHLAALILLVGAVAFLLFVGRPAFRRAGGELAAEADRFDRTLLRLATWSLAASVASALAWLAIQTAVAAGPDALAIPEALGAVLSATDFGRLWQLRLALAALAGGLLWLRGSERDHRDWFALRAELLGLGAILLASVAWVGHATATEGGVVRVLHLTANALHLLAAGFWLGGLLPLALLLTWARRPPADPVRVAVSRDAVARFSLLGLVGVAALAVTGAVNAWVLVGDVPALIGTPYGRFLLAKLALLVPLLTLAGVNRWRLRPRLTAGAPGPSSPVGTVLRRLRDNTAAEAALGGSILLIVGVLGALPPARHVEPSWPFAFRLSWEAMKDAPGVRFGLGVGGLMTAGGVGLILYGLVRPRHRIVAAGVGAALILYYVPTALGLLAVDAYPTTYRRPAVPYHAASVSAGARLYRTHCAVCHGETGRGDGPAASALSRRPADLTAKHTADHTAGDLFWWLTHGIEDSPMPGFADRLTEEDRWDVINFLRALAASEQARALRPVADPTPRLVAPDFTFGIGVGPVQALREHRGWAMVHLVLFCLPDSLLRLEALDRAWSRIGLAGARVIAVPLQEAEQVYRRLGLRATNLPIAVEGSEEIAAAYALFSGTGAVAASVAPQSHVEFLIDRQGYIRARWIPGEVPGWDDVAMLLAQIERLATEPPRAPAPDEHVH